MSLLLSDPRKYSQLYPESNILLSQALHDLATGEEDALMADLIRGFLEQQQDQLLSVAFNLAPSQAVSDYIWNTLQKVLNAANSANEDSRQARYFALPVVIVSGSTQQVTLPSQIDQHALESLFVSKGILASGAHYFISGKLYDIHGLSRIRPSRLYQLGRKFAGGELSLPGELTNTAIANLGEGVHLRFLCGVVVADAEHPTPLVVANFSQLGLELMQLLSRDLETSGTTLFPLPFAPCELSLAAAQGEFHRNEISLAVNLSNLIKKMRLEGHAPYIKLSSQKSRIQVEVWNHSADHAQEILTWYVQPSDNFAQICTILASLFADMHLTVNYYPEHNHDHDAHA